MLALEYQLPGIVHGLRYRFGSTNNIGAFSYNKPMAPFVDVRHHKQAVAYQHDKDIDEVLIASNPAEVFDKMNLSDLGPSLVLPMSKDLSKTGYKKFELSANANGDLSHGSRIGKKGDRNHISVISKAEVYFKRPQDQWARRDNPKEGEGAPRFGATGGYIEHKNLFSPYWHVRNAQPYFATRAAVLLTDSN